ncbi:MAG TPA: SAM-dependent methyltransferase, partial [Kofleriaceae bacterium]|nr:SAM-dependent methyltransferase [Kofleriaceae bacterium]
CLVLAACAKHEGAAGTGSGTGSAGSAVVIAPYTPAADVPEPIKAAIAAPDRSEKDRVIDAGRKPGEVLAFFKIAPNQKVAELFAGLGYTTELVARVVGAGGKVIAQNSKEIMDKFARGPITERMALPAMKNVTLVEQPTETPFPPGTKNLDAVICILNYHDFVWLNVDRAKLNAAVFAALKPGGVYGIVDHSAAEGSGVKDVQTLHRIDEEAVKQEVSAAGFQLDGESDVLRNADDKRDWNGSPGAAGDKRGTTDRFVLRFVKPAKGGKAAKPAGKKK